MPPSRSVASRPPRLALLWFGIAAGVIAGLIWWYEKSSKRVDFGTAAPERRHSGGGAGPSDGAPTDPELTAPQRREKASATERQAKLLYESGQAAESLQQYVRAVTLRLEILEADPLDVESRTQLALAAHRLHELAIDHLHDYVLAEWHAREHFKSLADFLDSVPEQESRWRREYFRALLDLGEALQRQGDFESAETAARKSIEWFEQQQAAEDPADLQRLDLMRAWIVLGEAELNMDRDADAARSLAAAWEQGEAYSGDGVDPCDAGRLRLKNCLAQAFTDLQRDDLTGSARRLEMAFGISSTMRECGVGWPSLDASTPSSGLRQIVAAAKLSERTNEPDKSDGETPAALSDQEAVESARLFLQCVRWLRQGRTSDARDSLNPTPQQIPHSPLLRIGEAMIACHSAAASSDAGEKSTFLEQAWNAVASALDLDPSLVGILHLTPQLVALRSQPAYAERLRDRFTASRSSDP
jgi:hypothetical protein